MHRFIPILALAIFLTACQCDAETDGELCGDRACGEATLIDRCGEMRDVQCGSCETFEDCEQHQCVCEPEPDEVFCADLGAECGPADITDRCGQRRLVDCGDCPDVGECVNYLCLCDGESVASLCDDAETECGSTEVVDSCGNMRQVDCGTCAAPDECDGGQCLCFPESDDELCEELATGECGEVEFVDSCEQGRTILCEPCAEGDATFGAVRDAETNALVEDALIRVYHWPPPGGEHYDWEWKHNWRADDPDYAANTGDVDGPGDANYEFTTAQPICVGDAVSASLDPHRWYRIRVDAPGYEPRIFYRHHTGYDPADCPSACPAAPASGCHRMDFELWPQGADHPQYPDLLVDPRDLENHQWQCAHMPDGAQHDYLIGLRVTTAVANVGEGPFHLHGTSDGGGDGQAYQLITHSDGSVEQREIESDFFDYYASGMPNFMAWVRLGLVDPVDECRDVDDRPADCLTNAHEKLSFCLYDSDRFDGDIKAGYGGLTSLFTPPPGLRRPIRPGHHPGLEGHLRPPPAAAGHHARPPGGGGHPRRAMDRGRVRSAKNCP